MLSVNKRNKNLHCNPLVRKADLNLTILLTKTFCWKASWNLAKVRRHLLTKIL